MVYTESCYFCILLIFFLMNSTANKLAITFELIKYSDVISYYNNI